MKKGVHKWSLFLDRDGVINERIPNDYVKDWEEFKFLPEVLSTLKLLNPLFEYIVVVTNQAGIGKDIMTEHDLSTIHKKLKKIIRKNGGKIHSIYHCPNKAEDIPNCRKPDTTLGKMAKRDFPKIDFSQTIMVGDSCSDIEFGKNLNMVTVLIEGKEKSNCSADYVCKNLKEFYRIFVNQISEFQR
ncbi:MAG: HAD-IIIA family hydrolase [Saprospiraceae bacterium]